MNELENLRPEVRCALGDLAYIAQANHTGQQQVDTLRAELLRLAARNAELEAKATRDHAWISDLLAENKRAEAELAALKADHAALQELCDATVRANLALGHVKEEWQPISTAPHEQLVLLFCPYRHPSNPKRIEVGAATWGERVGQRSNRGAHAWATHWMPLPPPPKGED